MLKDMLSMIEPLDKSAMEMAKKRWDSIAKPLKSLGRLEDMVIQLAGITGSEIIESRKKAILIFCADNGIVEEGVTQTSNEVTAIVAKDFAEGIATVNSFARVCGADVYAVDVGIAVDIKDSRIDSRKIAYGTKNFLREPAMTRQQAERAVMTGIELVREKKEQGYNLIITGEMGIGNTTTSSAVMSVLTGADVRAVTGKGAGLSRKGVEHKADVIYNAIMKHKPDSNDITDVLSKVGGFDICAMAGAFLGGAIYHVPVIIDGYISAVAANCAVRYSPLCSEYIYASHVSAEPAGRAALENIGKKAYLECGMCLGEGTGGVIGAKLFDFAISAYNEAAGFNEVNIEQYKDLE